MGVHCGFCCTKIKDISVSYGGKEIIKDVNIHIHCGSLTVLIGKNGAGKSTLLKAILGEVKHTGHIEFKNKDLSSGKIRMGYIPQKLNIENSPMSVYDLVLAYTSKYPSFLWKSKTRYNKIVEHLKEFGAEKLIDSRVSTLSGGELQRVMLAISTMPYPELLILDESISGIDENGKKQFYELIEKLKNTYDLAIILVSHDFNYVKKYADNVILLNKEVIAKGKPEEVFSSDAFKDTFGGGF